MRKSGLKLSPEKCEIAASSIKFLGNTITEEGISPQSEKNRKISEENLNAEDNETSEETDWFCPIFQKFHPKFERKITTILPITQKRS